MLTIAPLVAVITLSILSPAEFGGGPSIQNVLGMYFFAIITVPMWITYIPSIILSPIMMRKIDKRKSFHELAIIKLILISVPVGALCGMLIFLPILLAVLADSSPLMSTWVLAGAISGSISLTLIVLMYRMGNRISYDIEVV